MDDTISLNEQLTNCIIACDNCANACLHEDNVDKMVQCIKLDIDCADICNLTLRLINRDSEHLNDVLSACIEVCKACEAECSKHDHEHCRECADACHVCHVACEKYLNAVDY